MEMEVPGCHKDWMIVVDALCVPHAARAAVANLGEGNPASEELSFTLALIALRQLAAEGGGGADPESRRQHLADMEVRGRGQRAEVI